MHVQLVLILKSSNNTAWSVILAPESDAESQLLRCYDTLLVGPTAPVAVV